MNTTMKSMDGLRLYRQNDWALDISSIEQMCKRLPRDCWANAATGASLKGTHPDGKVTYVHAYCKTLTCRTCAGRVCSTLIDQLVGAISAHQLTHCVTLTLPGDVAPDNQDLKLKKSLRKLMRAAKRAFGDISYVWVLGCHRNGPLHLHMLINRDLRKGMDNGKLINWLKIKWHNLTGAHQVRSFSFPLTDASKLARYMVVKNLLDGILTRPELKRRRGCTRNIKWGSQSEFERNDLEWEFLRKPTSLIAVEQRITNVLAMYNGSFTVDPIDSKRLERSDNLIPQIHHAAVKVAPKVPHEPAALCCGGSFPSSREILGEI